MYINKSTQSGFDTQTALKSDASTYDSSWQTDRQTEMAKYYFSFLRHPKMCFRQNPIVCENTQGFIFITYFICGENVK